MSDKKYPRAYGRHIVVEELDGKEFEQTGSKSGQAGITMLMPDELTTTDNNSKAVFGRVVSIGNQCDGEIQIGEVAVFGNHSFTSVKFMDGNYIIVSDEWIMSTLPEQG